MINKYIIVFIILLGSIYFKLLTVDTLQQNPFLLILLFLNLIIFNKSELYGYILLICFIYYNYILNKKSIKGGNTLLKGLNFAIKGIMPFGGKLLETFTNFGAGNTNVTVEDESSVESDINQSSSDNEETNSTTEDSDNEFDDDDDDDDDDEFD
jgi:hypothetical protein